QGEPEEQRTIRLAREVAERRAREWQERERHPPEWQVALPLPPRPAKRRSGVVGFFVAVMILLAMGLGIEAVVSGPGGYAYALLDYVAPVIGNASRAQAAPGSEPSAQWQAEGRGGVEDPLSPGADVPPPSARSLEDILAAEGLRPDGAARTGEDSANFGPGATSPDADSSEMPDGPAPAWAEVAGGTGQAATVGSTLPQPLEVRVLDERGEPLADQVVLFSAGNGSGRVQPATSRTDGQGIARATWVLGPQAGDQVVTATVEANPFASTRFTARGSIPRLPIQAGVATGGTHTCMIGADGLIRCWGGNDAGQLGDGTRTRRTAAAATVPQGPFATVVAGMAHVCALDVEGRALCW